MKKFLTLAIVIFLSTLLIGCGENIVPPEASENLYEETSHEQSQQPQESTHTSEQIVCGGEEAMDFIEFATLEDFLVVYQTAREGGDIERVLNNRTESHRLSESFQNMDFWREYELLEPHNDVGTLAERTDLFSLETLHIPVGIPEEFELRKITVTETYVAFRYLPIGTRISSRGDFWSKTNLGFEFSFVHWDMDDSVLFDAMLDQFSHIIDGEEDLIDGKYFYCPDRKFFDWVAHRTRFSLSLPHYHHFEGGMYIETFLSEDISHYRPRDMVRFTEMVSIDLTDTATVRAMITELAER